MSIRTSWHLLGLGVLGAAAVAAGAIELGPPTSSARTAREIVTAEKGIVQSTVSGTGNVEPGTDAQASFQTGGTLQSVYVKAGDHVVKGQLLATLDPTAAELTLSQAQQSLTAAQDQLINAESTSTSSTATGASATAVSSAARFVSYRAGPTTSTTSATATRTSATSPATTSPATTSTTTTPTTTTTTTTTPTRTTPPPGTAGTGSRSGSSSTGSAGSAGSGSSSTGTSTTSAATIAGNIASAQASVDGAEAAVRNAETALHATHLYAPATGTVISVQSISPGDTVTAGGSSGSSGSGSASGGSSASSGTTSAGSLGASSSSSSSSSSSGFVEIVNTRQMTMTVSFSESDISKVHVGQPATVTLDALTGVELAARVTSIATLGTTSSSVVSYDATLTLDQRDSRVKPGMSASASVVTGQAQGVNLPNSAVTGAGSVARVNIMRNGREVSTPVVVGLVGDSRTQIVSGLGAGSQVVVTTILPTLSSSSPGSSSSSGTLGGAGGFGAGGGAFPRRFGGGGAVPAGGG